MSLVLLEVGCILTIGNHTTAFHYIHYFLYKFGHEHGKGLRADAGVGGSRRQSCEFLKATHVGELEDSAR